TSRWRVPMLALSGALALVLVVLGAVTLLRPSPTGDVTAPTPPTTVTAPTVTQAATEPSPTSPATPSPTPSHTPTPVAAAPGCPSAVDVPAPQPDLPPAVAELRDDIIAAALACDTDALEALAGPDFLSSVVGAGPEAFADAVDNDEPLLTTLVAVLATQ